MYVYGMEENNDKTEFGTCSRTGSAGRSMDGAGGGAGERGGRARITR